MIYRKIFGDMTIEYEGTSEEIRGILDREDKPEGVKIIGGLDIGSPEGDMTSTGKIMKTQRTLDIKDTSTNELIEELSKRTGVKLLSSKSNEMEEEYTLSINILKCFEK